MNRQDRFIPEFDLTGQVALVTGGSRSIGRACASVLAEAGASVVVAGRDVNALHRVQDEIVAAGGNALGLSCDVTDKDQVDKMVRDAVEHFASIDIVVASAGVFQQWCEPEELVVSDWDYLQAVNLRGAMLTATAAGSQMIEQGTGGSMVTISSIQGVTGRRRTMAYTASKHGLVGLTKSLALDWAGHNIRVNCLAPGFIRRDVEPLTSDAAMVNFVRTRTPMARWGSVREVALACLFLAAPASSYVTGSTLLVDGGWCAQ